MTNRPSTRYHLAPRPQEERESGSAHAYAPGGTLVIMKGNRAGFRTRAKCAREHASRPDANSTLCQSPSLQPLHDQPISLETGSASSHCTSSFWRSKDLQCGSRGQRS